LFETGISKALQSQLPKLVESFVIEFLVKFLNNSVLVIFEEFGKRKRKKISTVQYLEYLTQN
jgi:hypothetical protein